MLAPYLFPDSFRFFVASDVAGHWAPADVVCPTYCVSGIVFWRLFKNGSSRSGGFRFGISAKHRGDADFLAKDSLAGVGSSRSLFSSELP